MRMWLLSFTIVENANELKSIYMIEKDSVISIYKKLSRFSVTKRNWMIFLIISLNSS